LATTAFKDMPRLNGVRAVDTTLLVELSLGVSMKLTSI